MNPPHAHMPACPHTQGKEARLLAALRCIPTQGTDDGRSHRRYLRRRRRAWVPMSARHRRRVGRWLLVMWSGNWPHTSGVECRFGLNKHPQN